MRVRDEAGPFIDVADGLGVCGSSSLLEPVFSPSKHTASSRVRWNLKRQNDWYRRHLLGSLCVVASWAPPVMLHDLLLLSSAENQLTAVQVYDREEWTNQPPFLIQEAAFPGNDDQT